MKLLLKIEGLKPAKMPGADVAKYMAELAALLGAREAVHFTAIRDESLGIEVQVGVRARHVVRQRISGVALGGDREIRHRWASINALVAKDKTHGGLYEIKEGGRKVERLEFPGASEAPAAVPSARDHIRIFGKLTRLEGTDESIHAGVTEEGGTQYSVIVTTAQARAIRGSFQETVLVEGDALFSRNPTGIWEVGQITATLIEPCTDVPLAQTVDELVDQGGFGWAAAGATLDDLQKLRASE